MPEPGPECWGPVQGDRCRELALCLPRFIHGVRPWDPSTAALGDLAILSPEKSEARQQKAIIFLPPSFLREKPQVWDLRERSR